MKYILITSKGKIMTFYVEDVAKLYKQLHGGVIVNELNKEVAYEQ
jgi:hypothetical protein